MTGKELQHFPDSIAEFILSYKDDPIKYQEKSDFLNEQTACNICKSPLTIETTQIGKNIVKEEARCSQCSVFQRIQDHNLQ